MTDFHLHQFLL